MKDIIELLKKKGFVDILQHCIDATTALTGELNKKVQLEASKQTLINYIAELDEDDELNNKFFELAMDLAAEAVIKELDLKPNKDYEPDKIEKLIGALALAEFIKDEKEKK